MIKKVIIMIVSISRNLYEPPLQINKNTKTRSQRLRPLFQQNISLWLSMINDTKLNTKEDHCQKPRLVLSLPPQSLITVIRTHEQFSLLFFAATANRRLFRLRLYQQLLVFPRFYRFLRLLGRNLALIDFASAHASSLSRFSLQLRTLG